MTENLVNKLLRFEGNYFNLNVNNANIYKLINELEENIEKYKNLTMEEIYPNNDWVKISNSFGMNKYVDLTILDLKPTPTPQIHPYIYNRNFIYSIAYKCMITNAIGYTFMYKYDKIIHPFHIIKHDFKLIDIDSTGVNYKCSKCNVSGFKKKGSSSKDIMVRDNVIGYSCEEIIIKSLIE